MAFFKDKVIIVTGASSGIGEVTAISLAQLGAKVVLAARNENKLIELVKKIESKGDKAISIKTDISREKDVINLINTTISKWDRIDILISNAGQYIQGLVTDINELDFQNSFSVNFYSSLFLVKHTVPLMSVRKSGHIVFINSLDAKKGIVGDGPYVVAKCALNGFGDILRQEVKKDGIKVLTVYPGRVDTPMIQELKVPWISAKISAEKVVKDMIKGIRKNKAIVVVPQIFFLLGALNHLVPKIMDWFYQKFKLEGEKKL
jgi:short-subunit dehydrogenase